MAANNVNESTSPLAPPEIYRRSDGGSATAEQQLRRKKLRKRIAYAAVSSVLLIAVILVLALVVVRFETPKFRLRAASFTAFNVGSNATSFEFVVNAQFTVKNTNYGKFEYDYGTVGFEYRGASVGVANIDDGRVRARSTKRLNSTAALSSDGLGSRFSGDLGSDIGGGVLGLRSYSELEGEIKILKVFKKNKHARLNCTFDVVISTRTINNITCI